MSAATYSDFRERRDATIWQQMNRVLALLLLIAVWLLMISAFLPPYRQLQRDRASCDQLSARVDDQKAGLARLTKQISLLQNDPTYLETIARDTLDVMKEGETVIHFGPRAGKRTR